MVTALLVLLVIVDVAMIAAIFLLGRRQNANTEMLAELTEERSVLNDLRQSVRDELETASAKIKMSSDKVQVVATEVEQEMKSGAASITTEAAAIITQLSDKFNEPIQVLAQKQAYIESLMRRIDQEKKILHKVISRGEHVLKFFNGQIPYDQVMQEIEDQKLADVRSLLSRGLKPQKIAMELGITEAEVRAVAGIG